MNEASLRLFFALWPDKSTRVALNQAAASLHQAWGGRRMRSESLHLTLAFLGDTPVARLDALRQFAATVAGAPFTLTLDSPGCWQHNRVGWLGVKETPPALTQLVSDMTRVLRTAEFALDQQGYVPHVTLLLQRALQHATAMPTPGVARAGFCVAGIAKARGREWLRSDGGVVAVWRGSRGRSRKPGRTLSRDIDLH